MKARGFTLLEVMVAMSILAVSLTVISQSQSLSIRATARSRQMTIATMLARYKMVETEDELFEEGFSDFDDEDTGDFDDQGFKNFTWSVKVDKIELPQSIDAEKITGALTGSSDGDSSSSSAAPQAGASSPMKLGGSLIASQFTIFRNVLEQSIRRVTVKVIWKEGRKTKRKISVMAYFTDSTKIDNMPGLGGLAGLLGGGAGGTPPAATPPGAAGAAAAGAGNNILNLPGTR